MTVFQGRTVPPVIAARIRGRIIADYEDGHELELMRRIRDVLDPAGLMNPGKVLPDAREPDAREHPVTGAPGP